MKRHYKKRKVFFLLSLIAIIIAVAAFVLVYFLSDLALTFLIVGGAFALIACCFLCLGYYQNVLAKRAEDKDEKSIAGALEKMRYGEKVYVQAVSESPLAIHTVASINGSADIRAKEIIPFGEYGEEEFDDLVLRYLTRVETPLACLGYFRLSCDQPFEEEGPLGALSFMLRQNYGENVYYGQIDGGFAVFIPFVTSREETVGRARRVAQLYSYSQGEKHIFSKGSLVFYPDANPKTITSIAIKGLAEAEPLKINFSEEPGTHYGYQSAEEENAGIANRLLEKAIRDARTEEEIVASFDKYGNALLAGTGMETMGIALYEGGLNQYRIPVTVSIAPELDVYAKTKDEHKRIPASTLDSFYDWSKGAGTLVMVNQPTYLTSVPRAVLDSFSIEGYVASAIYSGDEKLGLVYFASQQKEALNLAVYPNVNRVAQLLIEAGIKLGRIYDEAKDHARRQAVFSALAVYQMAIDEESKKVTYVSSSLQKAMPGLKVGEVASDDILEAYELCLANGTAERPLLDLGSGTFTFFTRPGFHEREILISRRKEDFSNFRLDPATELFNDKAFHEDLQKEILQKGTSGQILAFRIRNADSLYRQFRLETYDPIVSSVAKALIAGSLDGSLYRNGEAGFAYLLPNLSRSDAIELSSLVARTLREKLPLGDRLVEFAFDYCLIAYPLEASNPFDMDSLLRILYEKADASSKGRLFENSSDHGLVADKRTYAREKFEEAIRSGSMPLRYSFFFENVSRRLAFIEAIPTIVEEGGDLIQGEAIKNIAKEADKERDLSYTTLHSLVKMLANYKGKINDSSLLGVVMDVSLQAISPKFIDTVIKECHKVRANVSHLYLQIQAEDVISSPKGVESFLKKAHRHGIQVGVIGANFEGIEDKLLPLISFYRFSSNLAYGKYKDSFIGSLSPARNHGLSFLVDGVSSKEEGHYLGSLSLHYGKFKGEEPIEEAGVESYLTKR